MRRKAATVILALTVVAYMLPHVLIAVPWAVAETGVPVAAYRVFTARTR